MTAMPTYKFEDVEPLCRARMGSPILRSAQDKSRMRPIADNAFVKGSKKQVKAKLRLTPPPGVTTKPLQIQFRSPTPNKVWFKESPAEEMYVEEVEILPPMTMILHQREIQRHAPTRQARGPGAQAKRGPTIDFTCDRIRDDATSDSEKRKDATSDSEKRNEETRKEQDQTKAASNPLKEQSQGNAASQYQEHRESKEGQMELERAQLEIERLRGELAACRSAMQENDVTEDETTGRFHKACINVDAIRKEAKDEKRFPNDQAHEKLGNDETKESAEVKTRETVEAKKAQEQKIRDWFKKPTPKTNTLKASEAFQTLSFEEAFNRFADEGEDVVLDKKSTYFAGLVSVGGNSRDRAHRDNARADGPAADAADGKGGNQQDATEGKRKEHPDRKHLVMTLQVRAAASNRSCCVAW